MATREAIILGIIAAVALACGAVTLLILAAAGVAR